MANNPERVAERKAMRVWVSAMPVKGYPYPGYWYAAHLPDDKHGSWSTYNNWWCRCPPCRDANHLHGLERKMSKIK